MRRRRWSWCAVQEAVYWGRQHGTPGALGFSQERSQEQVLQNSRLSFHTVCAATTSQVREKGMFSFYEDGHGECCRVRKVRLGAYEQVHPLLDLLAGMQPDKPAAVLL